MTCLLDSSDGPGFEELLTLLRAEHMRLLAEVEAMRRAALSACLPAADVPAAAPQGALKAAMGVAPTSCRMLTDAKRADRIIERNTSANLGRSEEERSSSKVEGPVLMVPEALRMRVGDWSCSEEEPGPHGLEASTDSEIRARTAAAHIDLDSRWHDLYLANEAAAAAVGVDSRRERRSKGARHTFHSFRIHKLDAKYWQKVPLRPHGRRRLVWDFLGAAFLIYELVAVPVQVAWNLAPTNIVYLFSLFYWVADIAVSFNTAFVRDGLLVVARPQVARHYLSNRFAFDFVLTALDTICWFTPTPTTSTAVAITHLARLVRAINVTRTSDNLEELCIDWGLQWLIVVYTVVQIVVSVFVVGHMFSCAWCSMGVAARSAGELGWIDLNEAEFGDPLSLFDQYLRAHSWISGHLLSAPIDRTMRLRTDNDHIFALALIWVKLFVMGAGISKITGALAELGRANAQSKDAKRKLHQVIRKSGMDKDASSRMIRFALHSASRQRATMVEPAISGLLSSTMAKELVVGQRMRILTSHPLFAHINDRHPEIFSTLCSTFAPHVYADFEEVFVHGTLSERVYVTCSGSYALSGAEDEAVREIEGVTWLCEVSLFARVLHSGTLVTQTFAESLTLTCRDLESCIRTSPACIGTIYRYARQLIFAVKREGLDLVDTDVVQRAVESAIRCDLPDLSRISNSVRLNSPVEFPKLFESVRASHATAVGDLLSPILTCFPEVSCGPGIYSSLDMDGERRRTICALSGIVMLLCDRYDLFSLDQPEQTRITPGQWAQLQDIMRWLQPSVDMIQVVLVFLTIRGLTKNKAVLSVLDATHLSPEEVLSMLVTQKTEFVPSCATLRSDQIELLRQSIQFHATFNFAQFLQGENSPCQIAAFQVVMGVEGDLAFRAYLLQIVGVMCGIRGDDNPDCPLFMDAKNVMTLTTGLEVFRHIGTSSPQAIYWNYIAARARQLLLATERAEHFVFARLACLTRGRGSATREVETAWWLLNHCEREALTDLLLSDGITQTNFVLKFLPAVFANAMDNPHVGLHSAMVVLVDLLESLKASAFARSRRSKSLVVNMQDLATFTDKVRCSSVFLAVAGHVSYLEKMSEVTVVIATAHMQRAGHRSWFEQPAQEAALLVRRLRRQFDGWAETVPPTSPARQPSIFSAGPLCRTTI